MLILPITYIIRTPRLFCVTFGNTGLEHLQGWGCRHLDDALERCIHSVGGPRQATALHDVRHQAFPACQRTPVDQPGSTVTARCRDGGTPTGRWQIRKGAHTSKGFLWVHVKHAGHQFRAQFSAS